MAKFFGNYILVKKESEIESTFNKIMNPISKEADPNLISKLTSLVNNNLSDNGQLALDLVVNKLQSNKDWEILISLQVLEALVKNCGEYMHDLISRFRFLNELIKLISPKYQGDATSDKVKTKCIELFYCWSRDLNKTKIKEAYDILKKQQLIKQDPIYVDDLVVKVAPRQNRKLFQDEEKLANLLKSKNPKELELANQLIQNMFKQDEIDVDNKSIRKNELDQINNGIKLLSEMLNEYDKKKSNLSEKETIKYLYDEIERMQPKIIELAAAETEVENTESIKQVLNASDQCQSVMDKFKKLFSTNNAFNSDDDLINICTNNELNTDDNNVQNNVHTSLKDLEDLFFSSSESKSNSTINNDLLLNLNDLSLMKPQVLESKPAIKNSIETGKSAYIRALDDLDELGRVLMENTLKTTKDHLNSKEDKQIN